MKHIVLEDIIHIDSLEHIITDFHAITGMAAALLDTTGSVVVSAGWRNTAGINHGGNTAAQKDRPGVNLKQLDNLKPGEFRLCKSRHNLQYMVTRLCIGSLDAGRLYLGPFLLDDGGHSGSSGTRAAEPGMDTQKDTTENDRIPRWPRRKIDRTMTFFMKLVGSVTRSGFEKSLPGRTTGSSKKERGISRWETAETAEPEPLLEGIDLTDVIGLDLLQKIQDGFSSAFDIPAIIYDVNGKPITRPSRFTPFCSLIRSVPEGRKRCERFDAALFKELGTTNQKIIRRGCTFDHMITGTIPIRVGGCHVANIGMGQMVEGELDVEELQRFCLKSGLPAEELVTASKKLIRYDPVKFEKAISFLEIIAGQISRMGFQNLQQARLISEKENAEYLFRTALEASPDAININRFDGTFVFVNKGIVELTGYEKEELIDQKSVDLNIWADNRDRDKLFDHLARDGAVTNFEADFRMKDGRIVNGLLSATLIDFNGEKHVLGITRDITEIKKNQNALKESEAQLNQIQKLETIGTLAGGIAHDFNNILFPVIILTEILLEKDFPSKVKEDLNSILKAGKRARKLVSQILTFSRKHRKKLEPMELHPLVKETIKLTRSTLPANIRINHRIDENCGFTMIDAVQFQQILMNLISNAFHAMEHTGGTLSIALFTKNIVSKSGIPGQYICIEVKDDGMGMNKEIQKKIFNPYFTTKDQDKGSGLGLAVVHGIIKSFNGEIFVKSAFNKGASFRVCLPGVDDPETMPSNRNDTGTVMGRKEHILVVDDEILIATLLQKVLTRSGFIVDCFSNSMDALDAFKGAPEKYDLIITDLTMPYLTGDRLCLEIAKSRSDIPIIMLTGYNENRILKNSKDFNIDKILIKPLEKNEILNAVGQLLK